MKTRSGVSYATGLKAEPAAQPKAKSATKASKAAVKTSPVKPVPQTEPKASTRSQRATKAKPIPEEIVDKEVQKKTRARGKPEEKAKAAEEVKEPEPKSDSVPKNTKSKDTKSKKTLLKSPEKEKKPISKEPESSPTRRTRSSRRDETKEEPEVEPKVEPKPVRRGKRQMTTKTKTDEIADKNLKEVEEKDAKDKKSVEKNENQTEDRVENKMETIEDKNEDKVVDKEEDKMEDKKEVKEIPIEVNESPKEDETEDKSEGIQTLAEEKPMEVESVQEKVNDKEDIEMVSKDKEVVPSKRKAEESTEEASKSTYEPIKRLRVSRFSVPTIPQTCGHLYSFGEEIAGELGPRMKKFNETKLKKNEPAFVTDDDGQPLDNIVSVVCGAIHSCALTFEGRVITFGCNDDSALGRDTQTGSDETDDSVDIDESEERAATTPRPVLGLPEVVKMTAGDMHTCVLSREGSVYVWGNFKDESKKLGLFTETDKNEFSDDFNATQLPKRLDLEPKVVDIASGCHHILLLTEDGDVLSFGEGSKGQLGRIKADQLQTIASNRNLFLEPQKVNFGEGVVIEKVWANHWSSYAKTNSGDVFCWGLNNYNQLGFKSESVVRVANEDPNESQTTLNLIIELEPKKSEKMPKNVIQIANGQHHVLALDADGNVFSCGCNNYGKLGFRCDSAPECPQQIPKEAFEGQKVGFIACGEFCSLAITESGHLMTWGQGSLHIGAGEFSDLFVPTRLRGVLADDTRFVRVAAGSQHTLLIGNKSSINGN